MTSALQQKSLTEIRAIAQALKVPDIFKKEKHHLIQAIELQQDILVPRPKIEIPKNVYDARLMSHSPAEKSSREELDELLVPYVQRGLKVRYDEERWYFSRDRKTDEGTLRMPLRVVLRCAERMLE